MTTENPFKAFANPCERVANLVNFSSDFRVMRHFRSQFTSSFARFCERFARLISYRKEVYLYILCVLYYYFFITFAIRNIKSFTNISPHI